MTAYATGEGNLMTAFLWSILHFSRIDQLAAKHSVKPVLTVF